MKKNVFGRIHSVESFGALDGPGIRYVLFLKGCLLRCAYCHNPDTWTDYNSMQKSATEVFNDIVRYKNFIRTGGLTISGGEPLVQPDFCAELLQLCAEERIHTAIDTCGAVPLEESKECIDLADMLLLDIKAFDSQICEKMTGMSNENAFKTLEYCQSIQKPVWIRHVILPGYTLNEQQLKGLAEYLKNFSCVQLIELLPFHKMGEYKWENLGLEYTLTDVNEPTKQEIDMCRKIFSDAGIKVK